MSSDLDVRDESFLVHPDTGELLPATVENATAVLVAVRQARARLTDLYEQATYVLLEESRRLGSKTLRAGGETVKIAGGPETVWDAQLLREGLTAAGCPDERIGELIRETVDYKVNASVAKSLAAANPEYAAAIERAKTQVEKPQYARVQ